MDTATWQYARFIGLHSALTVMHYANDISDNMLFTEAIMLLKELMQIC